MAGLRRKSAVYSSSNTSMMPHQPNAKDFSNSGYGIMRHDYTSAVLGSGTLAANNYWPIPLCEFTRTFDVGGGIDDKPPTPTAGNNFQTPEVFNGSRIENFEATIHIQSKSNTTSCLLTVYEMAVSFFDAYLLQNIYPTQCPVAFTSSIGTEDHRGEVRIITPTATLISTNLNKSIKFIQHYIKPVGKIFVPFANAMAGSVDIKINKLPAKCRRANSGMFYGLFLHNDTTDNNGTTLTATCDVEVKFDEIPAEFRLPYLT